MKPYLAIFSTRFRLLLQYRVAALAGLGTQAFWGVLRISVMMAFYASAEGPQPMSLAQTISYVWLSQGLFRLMPWKPDPDIVALVRSGNLAYELLRPVTLRWAWWSRALALHTAPVALRFIPMVPVAVLFGLGPPPSLAAGLAFVLAVCGATLLAASMTTVLTATVPLTVSGHGISVLTVGILSVGTGLVVPLPLAPDWVRVTLEWSPFAGLLDLPLRLYVGQLDPTAVGWVLLRQGLWTVVMLWIAGRLLGVVRRRLTVLGG